MWEEKDAVIPTLKRPVMKKTSSELDAAENGTEGQECPVEGLGISSRFHRWTSPGVVPWRRVIKREEQRMA